MLSPESLESEATRPSDSDVTRDIVKVHYLHNVPEYKYKISTSMTKLLFFLCVKFFCVIFIPFGIKSQSIVDLRTFAIFN